MRAGYKASLQQGFTEIGCMAHTRRKFFDLSGALLMYRRWQSLGWPKAK